MTLPANIRVNVAAPFPAKVKGAGLIAISKTKGIWTVSINFAAVAKTPLVADPANTYVPAWNALTGAVSMVPMAGVFSSKVVLIQTAAGPLAVPANVDVLIVKQLVAAPFTATVDWSLRAKPLTIVDGKPDALVNNITVTPAAGQTQMGTVNYSYIIDSNGGSITLTPLPDGTGAY